MFYALVRHQSDGLPQRITVCLLHISLGIPNGFCGGGDGVGGGAVGLNGGANYELVKNLEGASVGLPLSSSFDLSRAGNGSPGVHCSNKLLKGWECRHPDSTHLISGCLKEGLVDARLDESWLGSFDCAKFCQEGDGTGITSSRDFLSSSALTIAWENLAT